MNYDNSKQVILRKVTAENPTPKTPLFSVEFTGPDGVKYSAPMWLWTRKDGTEGSTSAVIGCIRETTQLIHGRRSSRTRGSPMPRQQQPQKTTSIKFLSDEDVLPIRPDWHHGQAVA